ncbi:unnamed protein product [Hapterophycus canaliculatus]
MADKAFESEELRLFHKACREGKALEIANAKSISRGILNTRSVVTGRTAVHEACASGHRDTLEQLLRRGADTESTTFLGGDTPLHLAVNSGERSLVFLLLRHGCNPNVPNKYSATCFHYAASKPAIAKLLLRYDGKVSIRDKSRKTPWDYVHEGCPNNRELNKMMKEAFDREEKERVQAEYALVKEEEDHANAKRRHANETRDREKVEKTTSEYRKWRGG